MARILLFNKPFNVLCQFTDEQGRPTLGDYIGEKGIYAAGRLDRDSEGLLLLTDDGRLQHLISHPRHKMTKTYWVQVEGEIDKAACARLIQGVDLKDGAARALSARCMGPPDIWEREPPVRYRKSIPTSWLELEIDEGRNRQVRRMTAAVGYPTLRLVRQAIGPWSLEGLAPGEIREVVPGQELMAAMASSKWRQRGSGKRRHPEAGRRRR